MVDQRQLERCLMTSGLLQKEANRRASYLIEDISRSCLDLVTYDLSPLMIYTFGKTQNRIDKARQFETHVAFMDGCGLNAEDLRFLSKVSKVGHELIPDIWLQTKKRRKDFANPDKHLDELETTWWLSRFEGPQQIKPEIKLRPGRNTDVDWQFALDEGKVIVNLEVKRKPKALSRHVYGEKLRDLFEEILPKFRPSVEGECNVAALSLLCPFDSAIAPAVRQWAHRPEVRNLIDAVLIWFRDGRAGKHLYAYLQRKANFLKSFITDPDMDDLNYAGVVEHTCRS